jgi:hypothetical protein
MSGFQLGFVGDWILDEWFIEKESIPVFWPFGKAPVGMLLYTAGGKMSVHMMADSQSQEEPKPSGSLEFSDMAYCGNFEADSEAKTVTHKVQAATFPTWVGTDLVRCFEFSDDGKTLVLSTTDSCPPGLTIRLIWKKIN